jgi:ATP-binding cassette subfamily B protein
VELDEKLVEALRPQIAWVDPAVQLWNRPMLQNLRYGSHSDASVDIGNAIEATGLRRVIENLPEGLETPLGEGGGLVSGGEGQRVRFARALLRPVVRLAILDEPFRGLDSSERHRLLEIARETWRGATLVWISHDIDETMGFDRVLVLEDGRVVEDGNPRELMEKPDSRLNAMHRAECVVRDGLWSSAEWRRVRLQGGVLIEP